MEQTLIRDDRVLVNQLEPGLVPVSRGDVVVFEDPGGWLSPRAVPPSGGPFSDVVGGLFVALGWAPEQGGRHLIKRVIGLPGDRVECCGADGRVRVNGVALDEREYVDVPAGGAASMIPFDVVVPADSLWVMGDNRNNSQDSRYHQDDPGGGAVPMASVTGRAFVVMWPVARWAWLDNFAGVFDAVGEAP